MFYLKKVTFSNFVHLCIMSSSVSPWYKYGSLNKKKIEINKERRGIIISF